eukprot:TRINITY_DN60785_c0_g1_i2.p1 TRINITY_DN60785_c0_g1~~TRINITY_DN60785_c0_g1_i2.p1  ORF type:complete len:752 (+),score=110.58 TRINITY_DN60785_c0_g1_i2:29-2284(+)
MPIRGRLERLRGEKWTYPFQIISENPEVWVGREGGGGLDIVLTPAAGFNPKHISRRHAVLVEKKGRVYLKDNNSTNGTFVNRRRIIECALQDSDCVIFGAGTNIKLGTALDRDQYNTIKNCELVYKAEPCEVVEPEAANPDPDPPERLPTEAIQRPPEPQLSGIADTQAVVLPAQGTVASSVQTTVPHFDSAASSYQYALNPLPISSPSPAKSPPPSHQDPQNETSPSPIPTNNDEQLVATTAAESPQHQQPSTTTTTTTTAAPVPTTSPSPPPETGGDEEEEEILIEPTPVPQKNFRRRKYDQMLAAKDEDGLATPTKSAGGEESEHGTPSSKRKRRLAQIQSPQTDVEYSPAVARVLAQDCMSSSSSPDLKKQKQASNVSSVPHLESTDLLADGSPNDQQKQEPKTECADQKENMMDDDDDTVQDKKQQAQKQRKLLLTTKDEGNDDDMSEDDDDEVLIASSVENTPVQSRQQKLRNKGLLREQSTDPDIQHEDQKEPSQQKSSREGSPAIKLQFDSEVATPPDTPNKFAHLQLDVSGTTMSITPEMPGNKKPFELKIGDDNNSSDDAILDRSIVDLAADDDDEEEVQRADMIPTTTATTIELDADNDDDEDDNNPPDYFDDEEIPVLPEIEPIPFSGIPPHTVQSIRVGNSRPDVLGKLQFTEKEWTIQISNPNGGSARFNLQIMVDDIVEFMDCAGKPPYFVCVRVNKPLPNVQLKVYNPKSAGVSEKCEIPGYSFICRATTKNSCV